MIRKYKIIVLLFILLLNTGCWNYVGANHMTVIAGMAIDKEKNNYVITYEIYNLQKTAQGDPIESEIIVSKGKTIFEAVRNAKKRVSNKLYFAESKIIIISEKLAKEDGINSILDWFVRDPEIRETLQLVVSKEKTAVSILKTKGLTSPIVSNDIENIIKKDQLVTGTTEAVPIYKIYNILNSKGVSLTLPAIHLVKNNDKKVCELNGIAIFKKDKMIDFLNSEDTKYYLLAKGELEGGIITIKSKLKNDNKSSQNISFEIKKLDSSQKYTSTSKNNLKIKNSISINVTLGELKNKQKVLTDNDLKKLQKETEKVIKKRINKIIKKIQLDYNTDILGYGKILHLTNSKKWNENKKIFDKEFKNINVELEVKIKILNTAYIK